jgi:HEAT repeat protein
MASRTSPSRRWVVVLAALCVSKAFAGDPPPSEPPAGTPPAARAPAASPAFEGATASEWTQRLASDDVAIRRKAAFALWSLGPAAAAAAPTLAKALGDVDAYVRDTSFRVIERLGADAKPAVAPIAALLASDREEVRQSAASLLFKLGPLAADAVPALTSALESDDGKVRELAAAALGNAGPAASTAWDALEILIDDNVPEVITQATGALARIDLDRALKHSRSEVRVEAMSQLGSTPAGFNVRLLDALLEHLNDPSKDVRAWSANIIGTALLRSDAAEWRARVATPLLAIAKRETVESVLGQLAYALGRVPEASAESVPLMIEWTKSRDPELPNGASMAFRELGERARLALPRLLEMLGGPDERAAGSAALALAHVGRGDPALAPALLKAMHDPRPLVARSAVNAVREADASVMSAAIPDILDVSTDAKADEYLRVTAIVAIVAILPVLPVLAPPPALPADARRALVVERFEKAIASEAAPPQHLSFGVACLTDPPSPAAIDRLVAAALGDVALARDRAGAAFAVEAGPSAGLAWRTGVVTTLTHTLEGASAARRVRAAQALERLGATAAAALPALTRTAEKDADEDVRKAATAAIVRIKR